MSQRKSRMRDEAEKAASSRAEREEALELQPALQPQPVRAPQPGQVFCLHPSRFLPEAKDHGDLSLVVLNPVDLDGPSRSDSVLVAPVELGDLLPAAERAVRWEDGVVFIGLWSEIPTAWIEVASAHDGLRPETFDEVRAGFREEQVRSLLLGRQDCTSPSYDDDVIATYGEWLMWLSRSVPLGASMLAIDLTEVMQRPTGTSQSYTTEDGLVVAHVRRSPAARSGDLLLYVEIDASALHAPSPPCLRVAVTQNAHVVMAALATSDADGTSMLAVPLGKQAGTDIMLEVGPPWCRISEQERPTGE